MNRDNWNIQIRVRRPDFREYGTYALKALFASGNTELKKMRCLTFAISFVLVWATAADAKHRYSQVRRSQGREAQTPFSADEINRASPTASTPIERLSRPLMLKLEVLLDRAHYSPGEISDRAGENTIKAYETFQRENGFPEDRRVTADAWTKLSELGSGSGSAFAAPSLTADAEKPKSSDRRHQGKNPEISNPAKADAVVQVSITPDDIKGPFVPQIPGDFKGEASLERLSYTTPLEEIGEKYHVSPKTLEALNPGAKFDSEGQQIWVPNVHSVRPLGEVERVVADKRRKTVSAYGREHRLLAAYPATIGSQEKPSPTGDTKVARIARNPWYTYDPSKIHFKGVEADEPIKIAPGPNNPVGLVWIALATGEGYGIHGAPEPSEISKESSHGCVRLTNWDALELASLVKSGTPVEFLEDAEQTVSNSPAGVESRRRR